MLDSDDRIAMNSNTQLAPNSGAAILSRLITRGTLPKPDDTQLVNDAGHTLSDDNMPIGEDSIITPSQLANQLNAPIMMLSMVENGNLLTYHSYGLAPGRTLGKLSNLCHRKCNDSAYIKADISRDEDFRAICESQDIGDHVFFIGVPIYDDSGALIGTIAILDKNVNVMIKGHTISKLRQLAAHYIRDRALWNDNFQMAA